ncbi:SNF2-related protein, partial [Herbiconiux daphne]
MAKFNPRPYQHPIIQAITTIKRVNIFASMGVGKTVSCLTAIHQMYLDGPVLVLAPLRVAVSTWPDEVAKWDHLSDVTVSPIVGTAAQRRKALAVDAMVYTCNYENLPWLVEECGDHWPFAMIIADESTRLKGFRLRAGSKRAMALAKVAHSKTPRFVNLTGTPAPNGLIDLWGQCWFIDKGQRLGRTFSAFTSRWFNQQRFGNFFKLTPHAHSQKEIQT